VARTFSKGGVHPPENKLSADKKIGVLPLSKTVSIPIAMHIGAPAKVVVSKKDKVKAGQIIAKSSGFISANIHSSVSGTVLKIDDIIDTTGYKSKAVFIKVEGDEWDESIDRSPDLIRECKLEAQEIIKKVSEAGVVGLGGATFPTHVKLSPPKGRVARVLIINAVECEPYLTSDHRLMLEKGEEIMVGTKILMTALKVRRAFFGIESNKPDAIKYLTRLAKNYSGIKVFTLKMKYPQGSEKHLIKALYKREVPSGGLPIDVGAVVQNVGTALAVYEAVQKNKPLIERVVTVTGKSLAKPANLCVRIGVPIRNLIEAVGGLPEDTGKIICGGPMMGKAISSLDIPVAKGVSGVLIMPENESKRRPVYSCIRCAKCISTCPMGLEPQLLTALSEKALYEDAESNKIMDCIECGSCSFTCPADRPLLDYIRLGKSEVGKLLRARRYLI
jgi:electron transport complex protein RnfC